MGQFSWLDCKTGEQVVDGRCRKSYVLVPEDFGGGHIEEPCYAGYGEFGGHDVYDLVADWNRHDLDYGLVAEKTWGAWNFHGSENARKCFEDFENGTADAVMRERYGDSFKREIGIIIACHDKDNAQLRYPIKITHDPYAVYEWCPPSRSDPNQGWVDEDELDEEEDWL